ELSGLTRTWMRNAPRRITVTGQTNRGARTSEINRRLQSDVTRVKRTNAMRARTACSAWAVVVEVTITASAELSPTRSAQSALKAASRPSRREDAQRMR